MATRKPRTLALLLGGALVAAGLLAGAVAPASAASAKTTAQACTGGSLNIVAHTDDDLLFLSPDIMRDVQAGRCTETIYVTAGEAGNGPDYWQSLEAGIHAAYAQMAGVPDNWTAVDDGVANRNITMQSLNGRPVSVAFLRLPDGFPDGSGSAAYGNQSILKLWDGDINKITPVDGRKAYTKAQLKATILTMMQNSQATTVRTQNFTTSTVPDGDHSDHWVSAELALAASKKYTTPHTLTAYEDYVEDKAPNLTGDELAEKWDTFVTFSGYDRLICNTPGAGCPDPPYDGWLTREYILAVQQTGNAAVAAGTTVSASSQLSADQSPEKARDGYAWGAPQDATKEWVSNGEGVGAWIRYDFAPSATTNSVTLYDRPDPTDQITSAVLEFSDGSTVPVGALPNNGAGLTVTFPTRTVNWVTVKVTGVSSTTTDVGLSEFEVHTTADVTPPVVTAAPAGGSYVTGQTVTLTSNETATIRYTTDGTDPRTSATAKTYAQPIALANGTQTLKYVGTDPSGNVSAVAQQTYQVSSTDTTPPTVSVSPAAGAYPAGQKITLTANEAATIYYTTDGSTPTTSSPTYSAPLTLSGDMTLKYFAKDPAGKTSAIGSAGYTIAKDTTPPTVSVSPGSGAYPAGEEITLTANEPATIYYTTDGSTPTTSSTTYTGTLTLSSDTTLKYFAVDTAGNASAVQTQQYTLTADGPPSPHDFTGDGLSDLLGASGANLNVYAGNGAGGIGPATKAATGWSGMDATLTPGDFNGDGIPDVLARSSSNGALWLYPGTGHGTFGTRVQVGSGWDVMTALTAPGDFNGDGNPDVLAEDSDGDLWLYPGDGSGGWEPRVQVGSGWDVMTAIVSGGDFNGDGNPDVLAEDSDGDLWLYPGDGSGGWEPRVQVGSGWDAMSQIAMPGDLTSDKAPDVTALDSSGILWLYPGDGNGGFGDRIELGTGWNGFSFIG
jgi:hypothetical protein